MIPSRPLFIVLEGIDGAGTTTQTARLVDHLVSVGRRAVATREPSTGPVGRLLRELLLGGHRPRPDEVVNGHTMALLFAADRLDHLQREVEPALADGTDVVSDRYYLSSLAYQAEESNRDWVASLARNLRTPDLTILLDVPVSIASERRRLAGRPIERYDHDAIQERIALNYRGLAAKAPQTVTLDGSGTPAQVEAAIVRALDAQLST